MSMTMGRVLKFRDLVDAPAHRPDDSSPSAPSSFKDAINRAFAGHPPLQPDADRVPLIAKSFIAQTFLKKLQPFLEHTFPGIVFHIGPPKDMERAEDKTRQKDKNLSANCDFSRAMGGLRDLNQIRGAIERFGQRGFATLENADGEEIKFFICDVDDTFSYPDDHKKPGLRNLDIKIAVPMGNRSYHICELQMIHEGAREAYMQSHLSMEAERLAHKRAAMIENALSITMDALTIARQAEETLVMLQEALAEDHTFSVKTFESIEKDVLDVLHEVISPDGDSANLEEALTLLVERRQMLEEQQADLDEEYAANAETGSDAREERRRTNTAAAEALNLDALRKDHPAGRRPVRAISLNEALAP